MASALASQLSAIAAKSTNSLDLKAQKASHSQSLIFEPKVAATQDFEIIYAIAIEGLHELCQLDPRFSAFGRTIFSEQSKNKERIHMTESENKELDGVLESFIGLLGARLLLRPSIKALDWLVRRFRVHEHNSSFLLFTFLPYHTAPIFRALLAILPPTLQHNFKFLYPYKNSSANPPRHTIVYSCSSTRSLLVSFNQYVLGVCRAQRGHTTLLSFWAGVVAEAVSAMIDLAKSGRQGVQQEREEDVLLTILPTLSESLGMTKSPELQVGSYMILIVLSNKMALQDRVITSMMQTVALGWSEETSNAALSCLAVLAQTRESLDLPSTTAHIIMKIRNLDGHLLAIGERQSVDRLVLSLFLAAVNCLPEQKPSAALNFIEAILFSGTLSDKSAERAIQSLFLRAQNLQERELLREDIGLRLGNILVRLSSTPSSALAVQEALQGSKVDLDLLEMKLQTTVPRQIAKASVEDTRGATVVHQPQSTQETLESLLSSLPTRTVDETSFLSHSQSRLFDELYRAFNAAAHSSTSLQSFANLPTLNRATALQQPLFFSFYIRVWCGQAPALIRAVALESTADTIASGAETSVDLQGLLPYALCALADVARPVRRAAAELVIAIYDLNRRSEMDGVKPKNVRVWGNDLYEATGSAKIIHNLSVQDSRKFVADVLIPSIEECILDESHITVLVSGALRSSSTRTKTSIKTEARKLKSTQRVSLLWFLSSHLNATPLYSVKQRLLTTLNRTHRIGAVTRTKTLLPTFDLWISLSAKDVYDVCETERIDLKRLEDQMMKIVAKDDKEGVQKLEELVSGSVGIGRPALVKAALGRLRRLWPSFDENTSISVAQFLLEYSLQPKTPMYSQDLQLHAFEVLRSVQLTPKILVDFVDFLSRTDNVRSLPRPTKRRRMGSDAQEVHDVDLGTNAADSIRSISAVLELVEVNKPELNPELLRGLFNVLGQLQTIKSQLQSDLTYLQTTLLGQLELVVSSFKTGHRTILDGSAVRADLLVECIRTSTIPQVHNAALLVVAGLAEVAPDMILHSVMPIFTFMGATVLRQDDEYSFHVINQTISQVIPPLVQSLRRRNQDPVAGTVDLLQSFAAAFDHMPAHRRLRLFQRLVQVLGDDEFLYAVMAVFADKYGGNVRTEAFAVELASQFSPQTQVITAYKYFCLITDVPKPQRNLSAALFSLDQSRDRDVPVMQRLYVLLNKILSRRDLIVQIAKLLQNNDDAAPRLRSTFQDFLETIILFSETIKDISPLFEATGETLDNILGLLPTSSLIMCIETLLDPGIRELRRKAVRAFGIRVQSEDRSNLASRKAVLEFLPRLCSIIETSDDVALAHGAITCVDQILEKYGKKDVDAVVFAATTVSNKAVLGNVDERLSVMSLLCLASAVDIVGSRILPVVPGALEIALDHIETCTAGGVGSSKLHDAAYSFLAALTQQLPWVISKKYLDRVLRLSYKSANATLGRRADESRFEVLQIIAVHLESNECLSSLSETWADAVREGPKGLQTLVAVLETCVQKASKPSIIKEANLLKDLILHAFDLRRIQAEDLGGNIGPFEIAEIEAAFNKVILKIVYKMNDKTFRPLFNDIIRWSGEGSAAKQGRSRVLRLTSIFSFLSGFFDTLKSIVTGYAAMIIESGVQILEAASVEDAESKVLWTLAVRVFTKTFEHDQDDFWQGPQHFDAIAPTLMSQIGRAPDLPVIDEVIPAITALAKAVDSSDHHKELNGALLKHMRSHESSVRLAAVKCEESLTDRLGEDWLGMLPEMLPFISELQEDDDEKVDNETHKWIVKMERILGESLDGMLQ
ncbi:MAG: hypothetical protein M1825_004677 [Sarcosagium campestre]|nr:MAG: hypothetical protein M1825_004677 [Sarcosagium campestre]